MIAYKHRAQSRDAGGQRVRSDCSNSGIVDTIAAWFPRGFRVWTPSATTMPKVLALNSQRPRRQADVLNPGVQTASARLSAMAPSLRDTRL